MCFDSWVLYCCARFLVVRYWQSLWFSYYWNFNVGGGICYIFWVACGFIDDWLFLWCIIWLLCALPLFPFEFAWVVWIACIVFMGFVMITVILLYIYLYCLCLVVLIVACLLFLFWFNWLLIGIVFGYLLLDTLVAYSVGLLERVAGLIATCCLLWLVCFGFWFCVSSLGMFWCGLPY